MLSAGVSLHWLLQRIFTPLILAHTSDHHIKWYRMAGEDEPGSSISSSLDLKSGSLLVKSSWDNVTLSRHSLDG